MQLNPPQPIPLTPPPHTPFHVVTAKAKSTQVTENRWCTRTIAPKTICHSLYSHILSYSHKCLSHPCDTEVSVTSMWYWGVCHIHVILRCLSHPCDTEVSVTSMWYWGVCHIHVILRCLSHPCDTEQHVAATGLQTKPKLRTNATEYLQPLPDLPSHLLQADQSMFCAVWINLYQLSEHAWSFSLSLSLPFFVFWVCYCELL